MPREDSITQEERPLDAREAGIKENWRRALDTYRVRYLVLLACPILFWVMWTGLYTIGSQTRNYLNKYGIK